jgi:hypothetical protein
LFENIFAGIEVPIQHMADPFLQEVVIYIAHTAKMLIEQYFLGFCRMQGKAVCFMNLLQVKSPQRSILKQKVVKPKRSPYDESG